MWIKAVVVSTFFLIAIPAAAFIGNVKIGSFRVPCAVACGGDRGIINANFAGDAVNNVLVGPSIENFEGATNRSVDRAMQKLDEMLSKHGTSFISEMENLAAEQRGQLLSELHSLADETVLSLDETVRAHLEEADRLLENRLGTLDALLSRQANEFTYSFRRVAIFTIVLLGLGLLGWRAYLHAFEAKQPIRSFWPKLAWGVGGIAVFSVGAYAVTAANQTVAQQQIVDYYADGYTSAVSDVNLDHAVYYSTQLLFLDRKSRLAQARAAKATILRDIFARTALYKTEDGARELGYRLASAQKNFVDAQSRPDPDLTMAYGFLIWQRGPDRFSEYISAVTFASALEDIAEHNDTNFYVLKPFASYYLNSYLQNPLPDQLISTLYKRNQADMDADAVLAANGRDIAPGQVSLLKKQYNVSELQAVLGMYPVDLDGLARNFPLYAYIHTNAKAVSVSRSVITRYAELLRLSGELEIASPDRKGAIRTDIRSTAAEIVMNWDEYIEFLINNEIADPSAKLNPLRGLWPIYTRALGAMELADDVNAWAAGDVSRGIHKRWLSEVVRPTVRSSTFRLIAVSTESDFRSVDQELQGIETSVRAFFAAIAQLEAADNGADINARNAAGGNLRTVALDLAARGTSLGLFGCRQSDAASWGCKHENALPTSFAQLVFDAAKGVTPSVLDSGTVFTELVGRRTTPAL